MDSVTPKTPKPQNLGGIRPFLVPDPIFSLPESDLNLTRTLPETDFCYPTPSPVDTSLEVTCRIIISFLPSREIALSMIFRKVSFTLRGISSGHNFSAQPYVAKILLWFFIPPLLLGNLAKKTDFLNNFFPQKSCIYYVFYVDPPLQIQSYENEALEDFLNPKIRLSLKSFACQFHQT